MTDTQILEQLELNFPKIQDKFKAGMQKYPTPIFNKDCLHEAFQETYDLLSYLTALRVQRKQCIEHIESLADTYGLVSSDADYVALMNLLKA